MLLYQAYEFQRHLAQPVRMWANFLEQAYTSPYNPLAETWFGKSMAAGAEIVARLTQNYGKPAFGLNFTTIDGQDVAVNEEILLTKPFCRLLRFHRDTVRKDPKVLVVAPMSGHYATLLRGTVEALLPEHDVHITDWTDAREVPLALGNFDLDDYVDYVVEFCRYLGPDVHVIAVCQPSVPVLAATALMAAAGETAPLSLTLMGGSIDARRSPTPVNDFAGSHSLRWFETNLIHEVPTQYPGHGRRVYPGFLQHAGFMAMNPLRHFSSHWDFYMHLVDGDLQSAEEHRRFYDEYNAVLDMPADYYLDNIRIVFHEHLLPRGLWTIGGARVAPEAITRSALLTIEGEHDDISGVDQTRAAHDLCRGIPAANKHHMTVEGAGHYGIFSGRRWRTQVYPQVRDFIAQYAAS